MNKNTINNSGKDAEILEFPLHIRWKIRMVKKGIRQKHIIEITGLNKAHLSDLMNGRDKPKRETQEKIENALTELGA